MILIDPSPSEPMALQNTLIVRLLQHVQIFNVPQLPHPHSNEHHIMIKHHLMNTKTAVLNNDGLNQLH